MDYTHYKAEDFLSDESFLDWYYGRNEASQNFWEAWLTRHPEQQADVDQAIGLLQLLKEQPEPVSRAEATLAKRQLFTAIDAWEGGRTRTVPMYRRPRAWMSIAASIVVLIAFSVWWFNRPLVYQTAYGETQNLQLPDGSAVVLNANSKVRWSRDWEETNQREVWLEGEAYFKVTRTPTHATFTVHSGEVKVEVLGTSFNVWSRQKQTRVVLDEGKVKLSGGQVPQDLVMKPGEMAVVKDKALTAVRKNVDTERYTAWKEGRLVFDHTPLGDLIGLIENNYGYTVQVQDPALLDLPFTYTLEGNDVDLLLETLAESLDLTISKENKTILIQKNALTP